MYNEVCTDNALDLRQFSSEGYDIKLYIMLHACPWGHCECEETYNIIM